MKILIKPKKSQNWICTIAIGKDYLDNWEAFALPGWIEYCEKHDIGLIVFEENLIPMNHPKWKKATWQKMMIGNYLNNTGLQDGNICYLDSDILISPIAPNIFSKYQQEKIGLVSQVQNLPQPLHLTLRKIAFMRNKYYSNRYPLDSALFMNPKQIFEYHNVEPQDNYACMGLIIFNIKNHKNLMKKWFENYDSQVHTLTDGGDEPLINYEMQKWGKIQWYDYEFQAIWVYEMAWKYPFLYDEKYNNNKILVKCIEASLYFNHFLHFAGSWYESESWKKATAFTTIEAKQEIQEFYNYLKTPVHGKPAGVIKPLKA